LSTAAVLVPSNSGISKVDQELFHKGYIAGWQSVRGDNDPVVVPISPVQVGPATFMIGFARGSRDANGSGLHRLASSRPPVFLVLDNSTDTEAA
jgi:hypothetical protein